MTVHRVAWRLEKPRALSYDRGCAVLFAFLALSFGFGWIEPTRAAITVYAAVIALTCLTDDLEARNEHREYLRVKAVMP